MHAGGDDRSPLAGLSGQNLFIVTLSDKFAAKYYYYYFLLLMVKIPMVKSWPKILKQIAETAKRHPQGVCGWQMFLGQRLCYNVELSLTVAEKNITTDV